MHVGPLARPSGDLVIDHLLTRGTPREWVAQCRESWREFWEDGHDEWFPG